MTDRPGWFGERTIAKALNRVGHWENGSYTAGWDGVFVPAEPALPIPVFIEVKARRDGRKVHITDNELSFRDWATARGVGWGLIHIRYDRTWNQNRKAVFTAKRVELVETRNVTDALRSVIRVALEGIRLIDSNSTVGGR